MTRAARILVALGATLFAAAFFLPAGTPYPYRGVEVFKWAREAIASGDKLGEKLAFGGVSLLVLYPYAWGLAVALACLPGPIGRVMRTPWIHVAFHALGGLVLVSLGALLLILRDDWIPTGAQWLAVGAPLVLVIAMAGVARKVRGPRATWIIATIGFAILSPAAFLWARKAATEGYPVWALVMGGVGGCAAAIGGLVLAATANDSPHCHRKAPASCPPH